MELKMIPGLSASALTPSPMQMPSGPPITSAFQMNPPVTSQFQASPSMTSQFQVNPPVTSHYQVNQPMTSPFQMNPPPPPHSERSEAVGSDRRDESVMGPPPKSGKNILLLATNKRIPSIFIFNHNLRTIKYNWPFMSRSGLHLFEDCYVSIKLLPCYPNFPSFGLT